MPHHFKKYFSSTPQEEKKSLEQQQQQQKQQQQDPENRIYLYRCKVCPSGMVVPVQGTYLMIELMLHLRKAHGIRMRPDSIGIQQYFEKIEEEEEREEDHYH